ncbi:MAG TPA: glycosyltransferase family 39 protein [Pyrinomonadaceae bacterium]|nr:glycosyltransferase family 39 protein [Pyrinomonadaceae bacterium]
MRNGKSFAASLNRVEILLLTISLLMVVIYFDSVSHSSPGFFVDEASIAYNAHTIAQSGVDEYGLGFPLYFRAFGEYKNPLYIYFLAAVYRFTGPSVFAARMLSAVLGLMAAILLGVLAARLTRRRWAGLIVFLFALLTPWLFEISRLVFEVSIFPAVLSGFLLLLYEASRRERWSWPIAAGLGVLLGLMVYSYSIGRLLAPLFALGLGFFLTRRRRRSVVLAWVVFGIMLLPLVSFTVRNPGALAERFKFVTYIKPGDTRTRIALRFVQNYVGSFSPRSWLINGDPEPRHHLPGMGSLLIGMVILAALGFVVVLLRHRSEAWWRFILYGLLVSPIPASLTLDHFHTLRLITLPVFLLVLTVPAIEFLGAETGPRRGASRALLIALVVFTLVQGGIFQWQFHTASARPDAFDSYYPEVLNAALAQPERPVYLLDKTPAAYMYAFWYATLRGLDLNNFQRASKDMPPPAGAVVISHELPCTNCEAIIERGQFRVYRQK